MIISLLVGAFKADDAYEWMGFMFAAAFETLLWSLLLFAVVGVIK